MRYLLLICFIGVSAQTLAQTGVSDPEDKQLQELMNKVESARKEKVWINHYEPKSDLERDVVEKIEHYYQALMKRDTYTTYGMMSNLYRDVVDFDTYNQKERYLINEVHLRDVTFKGETCALARGYMIANTARMGEIKLPVKLNIFLEEGGWHVFTNPYETVMFTLPKGRDITKPCSFRDEVEAVESKENPN